MNKRRTKFRVAPRDGQQATIPSPDTLDQAKLARERVYRRQMVEGALETARRFGRFPRERLRIAIQRIEHERLMGAIDPKLYERLRVASRLARAKRDSSLPVLKHESRAYTFRRRRAQLELEVWR